MASNDILASVNSAFILCVEVLLFKQKNNFPIDVLLCPWLINETLFPSLPGLNGVPKYKVLCISWPHATIAIFVSFLIAKLSLPPI